MSDRLASSRAGTSSRASQVSGSVSDSCDTAAVISSHRETVRGTRNRFQNRARPIRTYSPSLPLEVMRPFCHFFTPSQGDAVSCISDATR